MLMHILRIHLVLLAWALLVACGVTLGNYIGVRALFVIIIGYAVSGVVYLAILAYLDWR